MARPTRPLVWHQLRFALPLAQGTAVGLVERLLADSSLGRVVLELRAAGGQAVWVVGSSAGDGVTDSGKQPGKDAGAHDGQDSAGEERTGDANGGGGADADTPILMPRPVHLADTGSGARLSALLVPPFDQLISPSLHAADHTHHLHHPAQPGASATPPTADAAPTSSTTRTTPTPVGERCSSSGTASQTFSTGVGLGKSLLVPEGGLEPPRPLVGH